MKDQIKRDLVTLLPEDTSTDLIFKIATYIENISSERRKRVLELIAEEMLVARHEGQPTSRLTSLYNKI